METFLILIVLGLPLLAGFLVARNCVRHRRAIVIFVLALVVIIFLGSVPYAAVPGSIVTSFSAVFGYFLGRLIPRRYIPISSRDDLLQAAYRASLFPYRIFQLSVPRWWVARCYPALLPRLNDLDANARLWPFLINEHSMAMRTGFVVVLGHQPVDVLLTNVS